MYCSCYYGPVHVIVEKDFHDYIEIYLSTILPIITFFLGYYISDHAIKKQEKRKFHRVYEYFKSYYKNQLISIKKQISLIKEQLSKVGELIDTGGLSIVIVNQPSFILDMINKEDLFSGWVDVNKFEPTELIEILKSINYTKVCFEEYNRYDTDFLGRQNDIRIKWIRTIENLQSICNSVIADPEININSNPNMLYLFNIYGAWLVQSNGEVQPLKFTLDNLVTPIFTYFSNNEESGPYKQIIYNILQCLGPFKNIYAEWEHEISTYELYLKGLIENLETEVGKLKAELPL